MMPASDALQRLREGNQRFAAQIDHSEGISTAVHIGAVTEGQTPFAIILGCSDSRVPAELVFNQGIGDLFVIRVAGNIVAPSQVGSVEFAAEKFGTRLVVVLGHSYCGAVRVTLQQLQQPEPLRSPNLRAIVNRIRPAVAHLVGGDKQTSEPVFQAAVKANIHAAVRQLRSGSRVIEQLIREEGLQVIGAEYDLETGVVNFFED